MGVISDPKKLNLHQFRRASIPSRGCPLRSAKLLYQSRMSAEVRKFLYQSRISEKSEKFQEVMVRRTSSFSSESSITNNPLAHTRVKTPSPINPPLDR